MDTLITLKNLNFRVDEKIIFEKLSLKIYLNRITEVRGNNGSGKSTLLKLLCEEITSESNTSSNHKNLEISYLGHKNALIEELTFKENFELNSIKIDKSLSEDLGVFSLRNHKINNLSFGEKRKIALLRVFQSSRKIWVLDEPFAGLDETSIEMVKKILFQHLSNQGTIITSNHQEKITESLKIDLGDKNG
ncbi:MAG: hypothetical protein CMD89_04160 [Gammaproteobacteria bacterium]|nr:hypothetical protein [Gammaproteobacteria bacterium]|tara:strand:- start:4401 stop:4973 length:573 start_codon:yes stop_codon:yes gene_type:complete